MYKPTKRTDPQPLDPAIPALVSVQGLAAFWRVNEDTVRAWCRRGKLAHVRIGRKIMIDVEKLPRSTA